MLTFPHDSLRVLASPLVAHHILNPPNFKIIQTARQNHPEELVLEVICITLTLKELCLGETGMPTNKEVNSACIGMYLGSHSFMC